MRVVWEIPIQGVMAELTAGISAGWGGPHSNPAGGNSRDARLLRARRLVPKMTGVFHRAGTTGQTPSELPC